MSRRPVIPVELKNGPSTLDEALAAGLTRRQLQGQSWRRVGAGVHVWAGLPESPPVLRTPDLVVAHVRSAPRAA